MCRRTRAGLLLCAGAGGTCPSWLSLRDLGWLSCSQRKHSRMSPRRVGPVGLGFLPRVALERLKETPVGCWRSDQGGRDAEGGVPLSCSWRPQVTGDAWAVRQDPPCSLWGWQAGLGGKLSAPRLNSAGARGSPPEPAILPPGLLVIRKWQRMELCQGGDGVLCPQGSTQTPRVGMRSWGLPCSLPHWS